MIKSNILIILALFNCIIFSQTPDNLTRFNSLVDSVVTDINKIIPNSEKISLTSVMPDEYFSLNGRIISRFKGKGREIITQSDNQTDYQINIILDKAQVYYGDVFKEKLFGDFKVKRIISLTGNYNIIKKGTVFSSNEINLQQVDTVYYDDIRSLENNSLSYTRGEIPSEPFFSSLIEPVIAISAAALTVILFFTVRSK